MKVYLVYDEYSQNDGYAINHGVFATYELANEWIETSEDLDDEERETCDICEFEVIRKLSK